MNISYYFILYIIYSIIGWLIEVILTFIKKKKFINRGFFIGPYCPIYGKGALLVIILLNNYQENPLVLFTLSIAICSIIEYFGSYILQKLFNTSWWDYSSKKYNINGRICLETMIPFGLGCVALIYFINPIISKLILSIDFEILNILAIVILILYIIDIVVSLKIILKFKKISSNSKKDNTEVVTAYVRKEILKKQKTLYTRLLNAFPTVKFIKK